MTSWRRLWPVRNKKALAGTRAKPSDHRKRDKDLIMHKTIAEVNNQKFLIEQELLEAERVLAAIPQTVGPQIAEREGAKWVRRAAEMQLAQLECGRWQ
jgi:hypothetical protein